MKVQHSNLVIKGQQLLTASRASLLLRVLAISVVLVACACRAATSSNDPIVVNVTMEQQTAAVSAVAGRELIVRIPSQPGTGYAWKMIGNPELATLIDQSAEPANPSRPGAWETQVFRFHVNAAGTEILRWTYQRPWEKEKPPARTFALQITAPQK